MTHPPVPDGLQLPEAARRDPPRAWHYGEFYGLKPLPEADLPLLVVHGNCQAESVRLLLQGGAAPVVAGAPCVSVRIPAVHELAADEVPLLQRLLAAADVVVSQPIADDYHGLPLGTAQVAAAAPRATLVVFPVFRYAGLLPHQVVFTHPVAGDPPVVPYHDVRTMVRAAELPPLPPLTSDRVDAVAQWSLDELRKREQAAGAVVVSDLVPGAGLRATNTINHPGNPILVGMAARVQERLGWEATAQDPGHELLDSVHAPIDPVVRERFAAGPASPWPSSDAWVVGGSDVPVEQVATAQIDWYHAHTDVLEAALARAASQLELLGHRR